MYIAIFLAGILIIISLSMLLWCFRSSSRIYQFPMFAGGAWLFYMVPQIIGLINNPSSVPFSIRNDNGIELAILMCCICSLASFIGYLRRPNIVHLKKKTFTVSLDRVFISGLFLAILSYAGYYQLISMAGGFSNYINGGNYTLTWSGLPVVYTFVRKLIWPALLLCLLVTLKKPTLFRWSVIIFISFQPLISITMLGRREPFVTYLAIIGISLYLIKRWTPPKLFVVGAMVSALFFVLIAPEFRGEKSISAKIDKVNDISLSESLKNIVNGEDYLEIMVPVTVIPALNGSLDFGYGRGFYNSLIQNWVPTIITGSNFKNKLFAPSVNVPVIINEKYAWNVPYGSNPIGITDVFVEFWFFGAVLYYFLGMGFRFLWDRALISGSFFSMVFYVALIPFSLRSVFGDFYTLPSSILYLFIFVYPLLLFCKKGRHQKSLLFKE